MAIRVKEYSAAAGEDGGSRQPTLTLVGSSDELFALQIELREREAAVVAKQQEFSDLSRERARVLRAEGAEAFQAGYEQGRTRKPPSPPGRWDLTSRSRYDI